MPVGLVQLRPPNDCPPAAAVELPTDKKFLMPVEEAWVPAVEVPMIKRLLVPSPMRTVVEPVELAAIEVVPVIAVVEDPLAPIDMVEEPEPAPILIAVAELARPPDPIEMV